MEMNIVGRAAVSPDHAELTVAVPFAAYRVRLFNRLLDQLGEPSRFLMTELGRADVTITDVLTATGLTPEQVERLLRRLQQLGLLQADETPTELGRRLAQALEQGLQGAETTLWIDRLGRMGPPAVLLSPASLMTTETLAAGIPRLAVKTEKRGEVLDQQQRLLQWLKQVHRTLPLQPLIETLWGDGTRPSETSINANHAWEIELPQDQRPGPSLWLPVRLPMRIADGAPRQASADRSRTLQLRLPALEWRIDHRAPEGIDLDRPPPASEHRAYCLVSGQEVAVADLDEGTLSPEEVDWPVQPALDRLSASAPIAPAYLDRSVTIRRRGRAFDLDPKALREQLARQAPRDLYSPST